MKSFKKALAVMLSVLMVVFSFPFSAMALENPNNTDGRYATDYDVEYHAYLTNYDCQYGYGYGSQTVKFFDMSQPLKKSDLSSADGCFALIITVENLDVTPFTTQLLWTVDWSKVQPAEYGRRDSLSVGADAENSYLECAKDYLGSPCDSTGTANKHVTGDMNVSCVFNGVTLNTVTQQLDCGASATYNGQIMAIFGFQMLVDEFNITDVFQLKNDAENCIISMEEGNDDKNIVVYGGLDVYGKETQKTTFIFPEMGVTGPVTSKDVTYTYTFADGTSTTVTAAEGTEPTAPVNTADKPVSNGDGTHTTTTYSWPAFAQGTTSYTEVATPGSPVACTKVVDEAAVAPGHETPGRTEAWHCSVCNYKVDSTPVEAAGHTWDAGVVTPATCTAQGYTTYTCTAGDGGTMVSNYTDPDPNNHTGLVTDNEVPATCTATGLTEGSHCTACGATVVAQDVIPVDSSNHTKVVTDNAVDPTCTTPGLTEGSHCAACKTVITAQQEVPALKHDWKVTSSTNATCVTAGKVTSECQRCHETKTESGVLDPSNHEGPIVDDAAVPATCTSTGLTAGTHCTACGATVVAQDVIQIDPNNHVGNTVTDKAVPATCTSTGLTEGSHCDACGNAIVAQTVTQIDPDNHTNVVTDAAVDPTCTTPGLTEGSHCEACGITIVAQKTLDALDHAWGAGVITKEATRAEDGVMTYTCSRDASHKKTEAIPALGVKITVTANELGTTTLNGVPTTGAAQKVPYESTYTLKATANEGAEFIGWMVNGKMVSKNAVYTTAAYADLTYVPVFAPKAAVDFVVTFIDQFNKVIATIASSELAGLTELPSAPDYPHYTFEGYDLTLDEVKALTDSKVVTASYTKDETTYTVTAYGCTITVDGAVYEETATVSHDARVTVKPNSADVAKSWTVNSSQAAFGAEYSFYVTANVEVAYSTLDVTVAPTVANVSTDQIDDVKVRFLATRSVTDGYTLLESGFVYGKDMNSADIVLDNVNGTTCRVIKNSNMAADGQFALTVGIASKTGKIGVAAYIIVKDSTGTVYPIYAPVQEWAY